jgi:tetratricopeptide (TPR) repeat protein
MEARGKKLNPETEKSFIKKIEYTLKLIKKDEFIEALNSLKILEGELEIFISEGTAIETELIISVLHNIAFCYQQMGEIEEAASYIEACIYNAERKYQNETNKTKSEIYYANRIKQAFYLACMYGYLCVAMSCIDNHYIAIVHARKSLEYAVVSIKNTVKAGTKNTVHSLSAQKLRKKIYLGDLPKKVQKDKSSNISILATCLKMASKQEISPNILKNNTLAGVRSELKEKFDLHSAMKVKALTYYKLKTISSLEFELENDEVFKKIYNIIISLYLISSEAAMLEEKEQAIMNRNKAVAVARTFLPSDCVLVTQVQYLDD